MGFVYVNKRPAFVPMDPYEVEQFLYGWGLDGPGAKCSIAVSDSYSDYPIEWGSDFRMANRLFQRISDLGDRRDTFKAWCTAQDKCTVEDALKASHNMWAIDFYPGFNSDELLGEHALDNCLLEEYNSLPDELYDLLDRTKVGAQFREQDGGVFVDGGYLVVCEDFADAEIPAETPVPWIEVKFRCGELESGWHDIPQTLEAEQKIAGLLDRDSLDGLAMDCHSLIPRLNGMTRTAEELPELRELEKVLNHLGSEEILQYKALLELSQPGSIFAALRLAEEKAYYYVAPEYADPASFGIQHALAWNNFEADGRRLLDFVDFAAYGAAILNDEGYERTRYGAVYRNAFAQKLLAGPNTLYSGEYYCGRTEGFPTCVCWDPDTQKVWLELSEGMADSTLRDNFGYYQELCEEWGIRRCATQEDLEQVLDELGAQPYDQVMAPEEDQGFGGMGGMA